MSREFIRGTSEAKYSSTLSTAALTLAETYEELLRQRAQRLIGEDNEKPTDFGQLAVNLLIGGTLAPTHNIFAWGTETAAHTSTASLTLGEGAAHRALVTKEVAESIEAYQHRPKQRS